MEKRFIVLKEKTNFFNFGCPKCYFVGIVDNDYNKQLISSNVLNAARFSDYISADNFCSQKLKNKYYPVIVTLF